MFRIVAMFVTTELQYHLTPEVQVCVRRTSMPTSHGQLTEPSGQS